MVHGVAFCPQPPLLIPEVAEGAAPELDALRASCREAITRTATPGRRPVLLGPGPVSRAHRPSARGSVAGFGVALEVALGDPDSTDPPALPLSLTVGAWLLRDALGARTGAVAFEIGPDWDGSQAAKELLAVADSPEDSALLVLGDGSASRSVAAPGYLDDRAEPWDARVAAALASGDGERLNGPVLDPDEIAPELLCASVPVWDEVALLTEAASWNAELLYHGAPYGVGYFVAAWTRA